MPEITSLVATAGTTSSLFLSGRGALLSLKWTLWCVALGSIQMQIQAKIQEPSSHSFSGGGVNTSKLATKTSSVIAVQQWLNIFNRYHKIDTPMVIFSAGCFAWLKYETNNYIFLAAAALCMCIVPYTSLFLSGPERILFPWAKTKQKSPSTPNPREIEKALSQWEVANMVRILFPLVGGVMALVSKM
ncbi:DUF1772 domain-containing protein [Aspergillus novofumigatus IBT 16806]|uniref:DUF1772-domain-containing protein n=1 Tax=Aspergillus novofumigatus (strain IBT 16806) TaxID=1392255 RepID=A0A2I1BX55_ASPN1|nr:uncharacterized protein P174DRAFT_434380 [Aspergillus novofumigatus IBT 16806]PKX89948.1 hypothetical protein P174DRAFT_434380 [Aspergillus novofumigatus IBT 16806]